MKSKYMYIFIVFILFVLVALLKSKWTTYYINDYKVHIPIPPLSVSEEKPYAEKNIGQYRSVLSKVEVNLFYQSEKRKYTSERYSECVFKGSEHKQYKIFKYRDSNDYIFIPSVNIVSSRLLINKVVYQVPEELIESISNQTIICEN